MKRQVEHSINRSLNGLWATLYEDGEFFNDLDPLNYVATRQWADTGWPFNKQLNTSRAALPGLLHAGPFRALGCA